MKEPINFLPSPDVKWESIDKKLQFHLKLICKSNKKLWIQVVPDLLHTRDRNYVLTKNNVQYMCPLCGRKNSKSKTIIHKLNCSI